MSTDFTMTRRTACCLLSLAMCGAALGVAAAAEELGPPIGGRAPDIGTPLDQTGKPRALADLMGQNGLVLLFVRSADWCPYCQAQLMDINTAAPQIRRRGYNIASLSYDSPQILADFVAKRQMTFTFLSDPKSEVIDRYGLRDPQYRPGSRAYGVPRPVIFVLDRNGIIRTKLYEESYRVRPPATLVIEKLDQLAAARS